MVVDQLYVRTVAIKVYKTNTWQTCFLGCLFIPLPNFRGVFSRPFCAQPHKGSLSFRAHREKPFTPPTADPWGQCAARRGGALRRALRWVTCDASDHLPFCKSQRGCRGGDGSTGSPGPERLPREQLLWRSVCVRARCDCRRLPLNSN